ncbi:MAG: hypothetical protein Q8O19_06080, partial [Rectinemataceae bacterium]|nr:hypothetical protein [Rectinemataceae bacterium]
MIGGVLGSRFTPAGTAVGRYLGGMAGGLLGGIAGSAIGDVARDLIAPEEQPQDIGSTLSRFAGGSTDEALAQAIGIAIPPVLKAPYTLARQLSPGIKAAERALIPFTKSGAIARAEQRMQSLVSDPEAAAAALRGENLGALTPAQRVGGEKMLGLEKKVAGKDAKAAEDFARRSTESSRLLKEEIEIPGEISKTREFIEQRKQQLLDMVGKRKDEAVAKAEESISKLAPSMRGSHAALVVREELENALKEVKVQENTLWEAIPDANFPTEGIKSAYKSMIKSLPKAQMEDVPPIATKMLGAKQATLSGFQEQERMWAKVAKEP